ncbi:hypothetical protein ACFFX1_47650 [Dactylosporangium sucinum]|uniref:SnoaL-like domain-containing protein n=1 Tax=Dactylosporangium sucinum TaxID=1424081 RepID=A0A917TPM5_9ACTN|nr:hypothetical protein [Dactylosporangium sucinum]GGM28992.1 hypothetical protein GCM10007977_032850 [Dactylosporangium sucinum]
MRSAALWRSGRWRKGGTGPGRGTADNADSFLYGIKGLSEVVTDLVVVRTWADGPDVATWFELHTRLSDPCQTVNWSHVEDGRITRVRVTFDPRGLLGD